MGQDSIDRVIQAELSRRRFLKFSAFGAAAVGLAACGASATPSPTVAASSAGSSALPSVAVPSASAAPAGPVVANVQTGALAQAERTVWVGPFEAATGIPVITDERDFSPDILKSMVDAGQVTVDVLTSIPNGIAAADFPTYFEPVDYTLIDKTQFLPQFVGDTWIGVDIYSTVLSYNTKATGGKVPTSWADLFDLKNFPGKRSFEDYWGTTCTVALLADGVTPDKLYPMDVDRAIAKLKTIKSSIVFYQTGSQVQDYLTSGEVALGMAFNGRTQAASAAKAPVGAAWAQQLVAYDQGGVIKGSPHKAAAMEFLAFVTGAAHSGDITKYFPYPPANTKATDDPAMKDWLPSTHFDQAYVVLDQGYLNDHFNDFDPKFEAFKTS